MHLNKVLFPATEFPTKILCLVTGVSSINEKVRSERNLVNEIVKSLLDL